MSYINVLGLDLENIRFKIIFLLVFSSIKRRGWSGLKKKNALMKKGGKLQRPRNI